MNRPRLQVAVALACLGAAGFVAWASTPATAEPAVAQCVSPVAVDGDTIRCGNLPALVRLTGIDAPELPGHCRKGRLCAPGDPVASRTSLSRAVRRGGVTVQGIGTDRYRRTIAVVRGAGGINLSCAQIAARHAVYVARWDTGGRIARECGL